MPDRMTEPLCVCGCGRPVPDQAYAATACAYRAGDLLHDLADMAVAARDVATGLARRGLGGSHSDESRLPLNLGATERLNRVQAELAGWARVISGERGVPLP